MCGIAGQIALSSAAVIDASRLRAVADRMQHRGPDDSGLYVDAAAGLAFRRLSIIDLTTGHQPMASPDGRIQVVFNGEIYNHKLLRGELEALGYRFSTRSDTEVLVHGFRQWGTELLPRLEGMFALACWDAQERELLLARDRMGKKPLVYLENNDSLWFASEIDALQALPDWDRTLDAAAIDIYLSQQFIPHPYTVFEQVRKLPPAHWLRVQRGKISIGRWWSPAFRPKRSGDERELAEELRDLLRTAVRSRLESEVPLGAFLSGGVDSSTVVGLMAESSSAPVRTYTIGFEEQEFDERPQARSVAKHFGTDHHEYLLRPDIESDLPAILARYGEPYADKSAVPSWYVAREARRDLTVVLTGDGADDIFAGYSRCLPSRSGTWLTALPRGLRRGLEMRLLDLLVESGWPRGLRNQLGHAARKSLMPLLRSIVIPGFFEARQKARLYRPDFARRLASNGFASLARALHARSLDLNVLTDRMLAVDIDQYLACDLLAKADIATMSHSLEGRSPFLDRRVVEFALSLPERWRVNHGEPKWLVKHAFEAFLPAGIAFRKKRGFSVPVNDWLAGPLASMLRELLVESPQGTQAFAEPLEVRRMVQEHLSGRRRHSGRLWALLCFEVWWRSLPKPARA